MSNAKYGATRQKLVHFLEAHGLKNVRINPAQGRARTDLRREADRWAGSAKLNSAPVTLSSMDTMTKCVKKGIRIVQTHQKIGVADNIEVYAKTP